MKKTYTKEEVAEMLKLQREEHVLELEKLKGTLEYLQNELTNLQAEHIASLEKFSDFTTTYLASITDYGDSGGVFKHGSAEMIPIWGDIATGSYFAREE